MAMGDHLPMGAADGTGVNARTPIRFASFDETPTDALLEGVEIPDLATLDLVYEGLEGYGLVDARGGAEYRRVRKEWGQGNVNTALDVVRRANATADGSDGH